MHTGVVDVDKFRRGIDHVIMAMQVPRPRPHGRRSPEEVREVRRFMGDVKDIVEGAGIPLDDPTIKPIITEVEEAYRDREDGEVRRKLRSLGEVIRRILRERTPEQSKTEIESGIRELEQLPPN